jgi:radical SAM superfamily enzyme YgiQ (UPF0313 family)
VIRFWDDIFGYDKNWLIDFSERFPKEIGLPFVCYTRLDIVTDEYCRLLKNAGCRAVVTAIECGNEQIRNHVLNRNMDDERIISAYRLFKEHGLRTWTYNMIGLPGETEKEIIETIELNQRVDTDLAECYIFQPYPGTTIYRYCLEKRLLDEGFEDFRSQLSPTVLNIDKKMKDTIFVAHKLFSAVVDHPWLMFLLKLFIKIGRFTIVKKVLDLFSRIYWAFHVDRRIYGGVMQFKINLGVISFLITGNRGSRN